MEIANGGASSGADSHAAFERDDFIRRMSAARHWKNPYSPCTALVLNVVKIKDAVLSSLLDCLRWPAQSRERVQLSRSMGDPFPTYPERWEEVPRTAYDPLERLKALDADGVDAEVLFPNPPGGNYFDFGDPAFELDVVRAYNDALGEWTRSSDRYLPVAILPLSERSKDYWRRDRPRGLIGPSRGQCPRPDAEVTAPSDRPALGSGVERLPGVGRSHPFPRLGKLARRRVGTKMERLFAAPGALGVHRHVGQCHPGADSFRN